MMRHWSRIRQASELVARAPAICGGAGAQYCSPVDAITRQEHSDFTPVGPVELRGYNPRLVCTRNRAGSAGFQRPRVSYRME